ncbi:hypothetical protein CBS101457_002953 [Exobasidium rhododendri]|nr:hypothetical protein CBS101457_002953 [Exobasidium rhododendri]
MSTSFEKDRELTDVPRLELDHKDVVSIDEHGEAAADYEPELHWRTWMVEFAAIFIWFGINYGISSTGFWLTPTLEKIGGTVPGIGLWFAEGCLVSQVALTPIFGLVSDFSPTIRKWTAIGLCIVGSVGLFVAGSAHHLSPQGIVGVCLYGVSVIAYGPVAAIIADVFPRRMRGVAQGILYACGVGLSGFLADLGGGGLVNLVGIFVEGVTYVTLNNFLAQQVGTLYTSDPVLLGLHFGVLLLCSATMCVVWGYYSKRYRDVKVPLVWGYIGFTAAAAGFSQLRPFRASNAKAAYGLAALIGFSFGGPQGLILTTTQLSVTSDLTGIASSLNMAARSLGGALGSSIASAIFSAKLTTYLPVYTARFASAAGVSASVLPDVIAAVAKEGAALKSFPGVTDAQLQAAIVGYLEAYAISFSYIYYSIIPWTATAALLLLFLRPMKEEMNWHTDRPVEKALLEDEEQSI